MFARSFREGKVTHLAAEQRFRYGLDRVLAGIAATLPAAVE
jgi:hypothetical protein